MGKYKYQLQLYWAVQHPLSSEKECFFEFSTLRPNFSISTCHFWLPTIGPVIVKDITRGLYFVRIQLDISWVSDFLLKDTIYSFQRAKGLKKAKKGLFRYFEAFGPLKAANRILKEKIRYPTNIQLYSDKIKSTGYVLDNYRSHSLGPNMIKNTLYPMGQRQNRRCETVPLIIKNLCPGFNNWGSCIIR